MIEHSYVKKVLKTWNPQTPDTEIDSLHKHMVKRWEERVAYNLEGKMEEYEAAGIPPGPLIQELEGAFIQQAASKSIIDEYLGEYLEEIDKRSRGINHDYYAHLWTIQDPDGWKKTPWETEFNPQLFDAVVSSFPNDDTAFHVFMAARIEREIYVNSEMPEIDRTFIDEVQEVVAGWRAAGSELRELSFSHLKV